MIVVGVGWLVRVGRDGDVVLMSPGEPWGQTDLNRFRLRVATTREVALFFYCGFPIGVGNENWRAFRL